MVLSEKREKFQRLSLFLGKNFSRISSNPNHWSFLSVLLTITGFGFLYVSKLVIAGSLFLLSGLMDFIDGSVARFNKKTSFKGAYLDTVIDRYVEFIILFGLLFIELPVIGPPGYVWIFLCGFGFLMTSYSKAAASEKRVVKKELKGGILERPERILVLSLGIILGEINRWILVWVLIFLGFLTNFTAFQRIIRALRS